MSFPRRAAPKRGHLMDPVAMIKLTGVCILWTLGFTAAYEYFGKGFSKRVPPKELPLKTDDDKSDRWSLDRGAWKSNESAVYKKTLRQRIEESHFPKEFKDHIEKEGDLDLDQKTGSVGKFVFSRSKSKQAEVDARKEEQNKTEASPSS